MRKWRKWFAWHPVIINKRIVWLKPIYRKFHLGFRIEESYFKYTDSIFDVIKRY